MSASWYVSCDRSVRGSRGRSRDSSCGGFSNCMSCDRGCNETALEKSFVGGVSRHWPCNGLRVLCHALGLRLGDLVGLEDGGVVVHVGEKVGQYVGRQVGI
jgi:hypothetical protein